MQGILQKYATLPQLRPLVLSRDDATMREMIEDAVDGAQNLVNPDVIAQKFKEKYNNEVLGNQLAELRKKQKELMNPVERRLFDKIFT